MSETFIKPKSRALLATVVFLILLIALSATIYITEHIIDFAERIQQLSMSSILVISVVLGIITLVAGWVMYRLIFPKRNKIEAQSGKDNSKSQIKSRIDHARAEGMLPESIEDNFELLSTRQAMQQVYIAMFGEINVGKTAIVSALLPDVKLQSHAVGGSTQSIKQYSWQFDNTELVISDVPGTDQANGENAAILARQEVIQAHLVLFICDGDLTKIQFNELLRVLTLNKPSIVVVNKTDQYTSEEQQLIVQRISERLAKFGREQTSNKNINDPVQSVVCVNSGGFESIIQIDESGNEINIERTIPVDVSELKVAIQNVLSEKSGKLDDLRDKAVLTDLSEQLNAAELVFRKRKAQETVQQYTRKAVVGALAAVSPGTDIIIQAYLGTAMVKDVCAIYQIKISNFDISTLLKLVQNQIGRMLPLVLTITGNALKAFPGIGTLAGGLIHAVAYGLVFDALGKSMIMTLSQQTNLKPAETAKIFQEMLSGNMEKNTTNIIKLVLQEKNNK